MYNVRTYDIRIYESVPHSYICYNAFDINQFCSIHGLIFNLFFFGISFEFSVCDCEQSDLTDEMSFLIATAAVQKRNNETIFASIFYLRA